MAAEPKSLAVDENARRVVRILLAREGRKHKHLAEMLGVTRQTADNKLSGATRFTTAELALLAGMFEVDVRVFFDPDRPLSTTPVLPPVPTAAPDLLTWPYRQVCWSEAISQGLPGGESPVRGIAEHAA